MNCSNNISLPLGSVQDIPDGSRIETKFEPFNRVTAQTISPPIRLIDMTEPLTLDHMANHWTKIID